jgi:hypothetical protein
MSDMSYLVIIAAVLAVAALTLNSCVWGYDWLDAGVRAGAPWR